MMFRKRVFIIIAAMLLLPVAIVSAQEGTTWFGDSADGQWLVGVKFGSVINDDPGFSSADITTLVMGYQFAREVGTNGTASLELEWGESNGAEVNLGIPGADWHVSTFGLFFNYRSPGTVYFKTKVGFLSSDIDVGLGGASGLPNNSDTNFAYGAGFGVILGGQQNFNIELDWTGASGDNDISLVNLGGHFRF